MGVQMEETSQISSSNYTNSESMGEAAIIMIAIGSMLILLCAATIIYGLRRRRHVVGGPNISTAESLRSPTDYMNSLATWDRCQSIDDVFEKKRRSVWTLDIFDNLTSNGTKSNVKTSFAT
ncbi:uncharacterized protein [Parasteatoda tepidariorum]|uniref:Uncharacterized protein n=1 Tax=Parasteatoda tepidariorum TaxID=114398 RepID=A0A2L2Y0Y3_PARTP|nr:uncharacterized protein LOC107449536 [Parasteatoda tepidariorum]